MGTNMGGYYARDAKRDVRKRRLQILAYAGLALLAGATAIVVGMALAR
jgi:hypothetical protein